MSNNLTLDDLAELTGRPGTSEALRATWRSFLQSANPAAIRVESPTGPVPSADLVRIYVTRLRHLRRLGREAAGFEDTVEALKREATDVMLVPLSAGEYHGLWFLSAAHGRPIGFLYVRGAHGHRGGPVTR